MTYSIPIQDERYADSGRRQISIAGRSISASCTPLKPEDAARFGASHQITLSTVKTAKSGMVIDFDGTPYRVKQIRDPRANDPNMRGRYMQLVCSPEPPPQ